MTHILVINPGSTSTKIAVFQNEQMLFNQNIKHSLEQLAQFKTIDNQYDFRLQQILETLAGAGIELHFSAIIARGGLLKPIEGGVYRINAKMLEDAKNPVRQHACNLGALLANTIAHQSNNCPAYIADPEFVDELIDIARITGHPEIKRHSIWHALNQRAIAKKLAHELGGEYANFNFIGCHLGGGISIAAHQKGRAIDVNNALDGEGPFSAERAGTLPAGEWLHQCLRHADNPQLLQKMLAGRGGISALLGTTDVEQIINEALSGNQQKKLIIDAMLYQTARYIGAAATTLYGRVDAIFITGGMAHNSYIVESLKERTTFIAPIYIFPGENEMEALAQNAYNVLKGITKEKEYK